MTEQEAINMMRYRVDTATEIAGKGEDGNAFEDMEMAIKALEKQIPQKIFHQGYKYKGEMIYPNGINGIPYDLCPNYKTNLCTDGFLVRYKKRMKYCKNCGQRLDWS